jgi:S1-C subfamily serine protease
MAPSLHGPRDEPAFSGIFSGAFLSCVLLALAAIFGGRNLVRHGFFTRESEPRAIAARSDLTSDERATIATFEAASPAVVSITALNLYRVRGQREPQAIPEGSGSGFVWDEEGHIVTNYHVVRNGTQFLVRFQDRSAYPAKRVGEAQDYDLAVLAVQAPREKLRPLPLGVSRDLRVGQRAYAIGYPFDLDQTLTTGVISGLDRFIQSQSNLRINGVIQTDAAINPGNSGGPLLDSSGHLIGINTAIASASGGSAGVGFAVPVDTVNRIVPRILTEGTLERAGLGVGLAADFLAADAGLAGAVIGGISPDGPAARAGLVGARESESGVILGDIIVGIDEQEIRNGADLYQALEIYRVGEEVRVRLNRAGRAGKRVIEELDVRLAELPD